MGDVMAGFWISKYNCWGIDEETEQQHRMMHSHVRGNELKERIFVSSIITDR